MLLIKKEFENQSIVLSCGTLINSDNVKSAWVQKKIVGNKSVFHYFIEVSEPEPIKIQDDVKPKRIKK
jgi:5-formaminoimidazole-4-carboxamide-1-beta-D-ribofuranosyl 5'-monophosphate synthetase